MASLDPQRPNFVFLLTDDQGPWAMGCAGNHELRTPNLDRIAATGMRFTDFFCTSPVCSPARASIVTGRIPSQHGVHDWLRAGNSTIEGDAGGELIEYLEGQPGYTDLLAAGGYRCGLSGKWHLGDAHHVQKSFQFWEVHAKGGGPYYNAPMIRDGEVYKEPRYVTEVITDNGLRFLGEQAADDGVPFYLGIHYTAPHSPWGRDQHPEKLYDSYRSGCDFDSIPHDPKHPFANPGFPDTEEKRRDTLSGYFAAVTAMDEQVGRVLDALEANGLRENTLLIFTSDNGMSMGHHGIYGKGNGTFPQNMYDSAVKVPMLISRPGHVPSGAATDAMLSQYDLMPTILDYVGIENPQAESLPGASFAALLRGQPLAGREDVVVYDEYGPVRMIRDREWKYVHRHPYGPHELHHLSEDPEERVNLVAAPECAERVAAMRRRLEAWFVRWADPRLDGAREGVTGSGQLGRAGTLGSGGPRYAPKGTPLEWPAHPPVGAAGC